MITTISIQTFLYMTTYSVYDTWRDYCAFSEFLLTFIHNLLFFCVVVDSALTIQKSYSVIDYIIYIVY